MSIHYHNCKHAGIRFFLIFVTAPPKYLAIQITSGGPSACSSVQSYKVIPLKTVLMNLYVDLLSLSSICFHPVG